LFLDKAKIYIKSGKGGDGCLSFRREKYIPFGGPNGGNGGDGGSIYLKSSNMLQTLYDFRYRKHLKAGNGQPGKGRNQNGKKGDDLVIKIPCGTIVSYEEDHIKKTIDLTEHEQTICLAKGGKGGKGNAHFATSTNRTPRIFQKGKPGEEKEIDLELKLIADIGIIGMPNAGKSTLLAHLTAAKPAIANYPFTTLHPNLGVIEYTDRYITIADIPGLIAGAHKGVGLGDDFLKHIERTKFLIHVIDLSDSEPIKNYKIINNELKQYSQKLAEKKQLLVLNKIDLAIPQKTFESFENYDSLAISAATGQGLAILKEKIAKLFPHNPY